MKLGLTKEWIPWDVLVHPVEDRLLVAADVPGTHTIDMVGIRGSKSRGFTLECHVGATHNALPVVIKAVINVLHHELGRPRQIVAAWVRA